MSEEINETIQAEEPIETTSKAEASPGFISKEEWVSQGKDPNEWVPEEIYKDRGQWFNEIKHLKNSINSLVNYNAKMENYIKGLDVRDQQKTYYDLAARRAEAIEQGDPRLIDAYSQQMGQVQNSIQQTQAALSMQPDIALHIQNFCVRNADWFNESTPLNHAMSTFAVKETERLRVSNPNWTPDQLLATVEENVQKQFKGSKVTELPSGKPSPVASPHQTVSKSAKVTMHDLNAEEKNIYKYISQKYKEVGKTYTVEDFMATRQKIEQTNSKRGR